MLGRPSDYTLEIAEKLCAWIERGGSIRAACREPNMPAEDAVYRWLRVNAEFREKYARARETSAEVFADDVVEISDAVEGCTDNAVVQAARLRIDSRKWAAGKHAPKKYGDKVSVGGDADNPLKVYHQVNYVIVDPKEPSEG